MIAGEATRTPRSRGDRADGVQARSPLAGEGRAPARPRPPARDTAVSGLVLVSLFLGHAIAIALGVAHVGQRQRVVRLGYEISQASAELRTLEEENRRLRLERALLANPERIERVARSRGMRWPGDDQIRVAPQRAAGRGSKPASDQGDRP